MNPSIAVRLSLMFALAAVIVFSLVGLALQRVLSRDLEHHQVDELRTRMEVMDHMISRTATLEKWLRVHDKLDALTPGDNSARFWALSQDPRFEYGDTPGALRDDLDRRDGLGELQLNEDGYPLKTLTRTMPALGERPDVRIVVGIDSTRFHETQRAFLVALLVLSGLGVVIVAGLGYWIAKMGLGPLSRLSEEARQISPRNLSQRLVPASCPDELTNLVAGFNGALDRLEAAYKQLEAFNADVAHELRTPLTNMIGQTQVALSKERSAEQHRDVLQSNLEELDRLRTIVNDMLFLARADQGVTASDPVPTSLAAEVDKAADFLEFVLDDAGVTLRVEGDARAAIDPSLFGRAITNLLQNAVQHSEPGAGLVVRIDQDGAGARVAVANPGAPIEPEHLERLFDRFYRVEACRGNSGENHGLGLSIVKAVATMHNGTVFASSEGGINTVGFTVNVPAA
ncbi:heavy metal sensor histidine kinase [Iodidimonas sp. SYSU 1G8]|uniref:heavy metal sensor histidine kinase n=1 Tax=Iodidimonas sp. SYSU 1G8 TaxID=3133967 RepID=UPI0031FEDA55